MKVSVLEKNKEKAIIHLVILSEAKNPVIQTLRKERFFASLRMTRTLLVECGIT